MVIIEFDIIFEKRIKKLKDEMFKLKVKKQISKIIENPEIGKSMKYARKGVREIYISPFRLSYAYAKEENKIIFFDLYHKGEQ